MKRDVVLNELSIMTLGKRNQTPNLLDIFYTPVFLLARAEPLHCSRGMPAGHHPDSQSHASKPFDSLL